MNFSIAYGKTVHGFMKDWNCSEEEARNTVALWYSDRPEVRVGDDKVWDKAEAAKRRTAEDNLHSYRQRLAEKD